MCSFLTGCADGLVRLVGGHDHEGTVELCVNGLWTLVGDDAWDDNDAEVVCTQLGLDYTCE